MQPVLRSGDRADNVHSTVGFRRFETRAIVGWMAVVLGAAPFLLLWLLMQNAWAPLAVLDGDVAADLNAVVSQSPVAVGVLTALTTLGGTETAVLLFSLATLFLIVRRRRRLAVFVATTGIGLSVLVPVTKAIVDRARPVVASPVVDTPSNASFPSGHATTALVTFGMLLLLALPGVSRGARPWLIAGTAVVVVAVALTRLALGVHFVSDVLAGWALGAGWLAVTVAAFQIWQDDRGVDPDEPLDPLHLEPERAIHPASSPEPVLPQGRATIGRLLTAAAALLAGISALGLLVTNVLGTTWLGQFDRQVVRWFVQLRTSDLTTVMQTVGMLSGTWTVISVGLSVAVLALAVTRSWRPVLFVLITLVGEVLLYLLSAQAVGRLRPRVPDLTGELPVAASWPSGHAAASVALYGAIAAVVLTHTRSRWRWTVLALPLLLAPLIGVSRIYVAAHHPTDVLAGFLLGGVWVATCAYLLLPPSRRYSSNDTPPAKALEVRSR